MEKNSIGKIDINNKKMILLTGIVEKLVRLEDFDSLKNIIESLIINKQSKVLIVGCGNSEFSERMYDAGWNHIYNIDISENVINSMKERNSLRKHMKCIWD